MEKPCSSVEKYGFVLLLLSDSEWNRRRGLEGKLDASNRRTVLCILEKIFFTLDRSEDPKNKKSLCNQKLFHLGNPLCDPAGNRTPNPQIRNLMLYPVELPDQYFYS
jgi:hypothetical protein